MFWIRQTEKEIGPCAATAECIIGIHELRSRAEQLSVAVRRVLWVFAATHDGMAALNLLTRE